MVNVLFFSCKIHICTFDALCVCDTSEPHRPSSTHLSHLMQNEYVLAVVAPERKQLVTVSELSLDTVSSYFCKPTLRVKLLELDTPPKVKDE